MSCSHGRCCECASDRLHWRCACGRARLPRVQGARPSSPATPDRFAMETLFFSALDQLLSPYIADLSRDKLRAVWWHGNVVLSDLELRPEAAHVREVEEDEHRRAEVLRVRASVIKVILNVM